MAKSRRDFFTALSFNGIHPEHRDGDPEVEGLLAALKPAQDTTTSGRRHFLKVAAVTSAVVAADPSKIFSQTLGELEPIKQRSLANMNTAFVVVPDRPFPRATEFQGVKINAGDTLATLMHELLSRQNLTAPFVVSAGSSKNTIVSMIRGVPESFALGQIRDAVDFIRKTTEGFGMTNQAVYQLIASR